MLETSMFRTWIHPMRALELKNVAKALHPGGVDQIFFCLFDGRGVSVGDRE